MFPNFRQDWIISKMHKRQKTWVQRFKDTGWVRTSKQMEQVYSGKSSRQRGTMSNLLHNEWALLRFRSPTSMISVDSEQQG